MGRGKRIEYVRYWRYFCTLFFVGFLVGSIFTGISFQYQNVGESTIRVFRIEQFLNRKIEAKQSFRYLLRIRMAPVLSGMVIAMTVFGGVFASMVNFGYGFLCGVLLTIALLQNGIKGFLLFIGTLMPQMLIYFPALILMSCVCNAWSENTRLGGGRIQKESIRYGLVYLLGAVLVLWGIFLESYICPQFLGILLDI
ncbi:MAG: stage II sporulation protein M [Fusicatenibacter sp.]|nr:stage II sporulation protein M [Fusicatenibacter sp.]